MGTTEIAVYVVQRRSYSLAVKAVKAGDLVTCAFYVQVSELGRAFWYTPSAVGAVPGVSLAPLSDRDEDAVIEAVIGHEEDSWPCRVEARQEPEGSNLLHYRRVGSNGFRRAKEDEPTGAQYALVETHGIERFDAADLPGLIGTELAARAAQIRPSAEFFEGWALGGARLVEAGSERIQAEGHRGVLMPRAKAADLPLPSWLILAPLKDALGSSVAPPEWAEPLAIARVTATRQESDGTHMVLLAGRTWVAWERWLAWFNVA